METENNLLKGWTTTEAAEFLGVSRKFIRSLIYRSKIKANKHGRDWNISPESVKAYMTAPKDKGGRPRRITEYCPKCQAPRGMRISHFKREEEDEEGNLQELITITYHCEVCSSFVRSVEEDVKEEIKE